MIERSVTQSATDSQPIHSRIMRGLSHYSKHAANIEVVDDDVYFVPSDSRKSRKYKVRLDVVGTNGERIDICECEDYVNQGHKHGLCRHTVAAMVFWAKGSSLGHARRYASYWIEYRTELRDYGYWIPCEGFVLCEAMVGKSGHRWVSEILPNGNYRHYCADHRQDFGEGATLVGTYRNARERADAIRRLRSEGRAA